MARKPRSKSDSDMLDSNLDMSVEGRIARLESELEDYSLLGDANNREILKLGSRFEKLSKDFDEIAEGASAEDLEEVQNSLNEIGERFKAVEEGLESKSAELTTAVESNKQELTTSLESFNLEVSNKIENLDASMVSRMEDLRTEIKQSSEAQQGEFANFKADQESFNKGTEEKIQVGLTSIQEDLDKFKAEVKEEQEKQVKTLESITDDKLVKAEESLQLLRLEFEELKDSLEGADSAAERLKTTSAGVDALKERLDDYAPKFDEAIARAQEAQAEVDKHVSAINMTMRLVEQLDERVKDIGKNAEVVAAMPKVSADSSGVAATQVVAPVAPVVQVVAPPVAQEDDVPIPPVSDSLGYELDDILQVVISHGASDLHLQVGNTPTVRLNGDLVPVGDTELASEDTKALVYPAMNRQQRISVNKGQEVSFAHVTADGVRFIVNAFLERGNLSANFHMLRTEILPFEALGLPPIVKKLSLFQSGLVLLTGPVGSGKSTTMASMIDYINNNRKCHIVTIEDPIEYFHKKVNSFITQREVETDTKSFKDAINTAMRQDPDVLVVSDIKDADTLMAVVTAAEKGYLVIAAMNVPDTVQAIRRMILTFSGESQRQFSLLLAGALRGIISQKLINRADDKGRIPAVEVLVCTDTAASMIMDGNFEGLSAYLQQGGVEGMQSFAQSVSALYSQGLVVKEEGEDFVRDFGRSEAVQDFQVNDSHVDSVSGADFDDGNDTIMNWL